MAQTRTQSDRGREGQSTMIRKFLEESDEEQITITDLVNKMQEYLQGSEEQTYSAVYMKAKLKEHSRLGIFLQNWAKFE